MTKKDYIMVANGLLAAKQEMYYVIAQCNLKPSVKGLLDDYVRLYEDTAIAKLGTRFKLDNKRYIHEAFKHQVKSNIILT